MGWADKYIAELKRGRPVTFRPRGRSMEGLIADNQLVTVHPLHTSIPEVGDVVLCTIGSAQYLHLVKAERNKRFQIGNNKGGVNGWIGVESIHGIYVVNPESK